MSTLRIDADELVRAQGLLARVINEFDRTDRVTYETAGYTGHERLAATVRDFADGWDIGRGKLRDNLQFLLDAVGSVLDTFDDLDRSLGQSVGGAGGALSPSGGQLVEPLVRTSEPPASGDGVPAGGGGGSPTVGAGPNAVDAPLPGPMPEGMVTPAPGPLPEGMVMPVPEPPLLENIITSPGEVISPEVIGLWDPVEPEIIDSIGDGPADNPGNAGAAIPSSPEEPVQPAQPAPPAESGQNPSPGQAASAGSSAAGGHGAGGSGEMSGSVSTAPLGDGVEGGEPDASSTESSALGDSDTADGGGRLPRNQPDLLGDPGHGDSDASANGLGIAAGAGIAAAGVGLGAAGVAAQSRNRDRRPRPVEVKPE